MKRLPANAGWSVRDYAQLSVMKAKVDKLALFEVELLHSPIELPKLLVGEVIHSHGR
jgi:hypothetical protein